MFKSIYQAAAAAAAAARMQKESKLDSRSTVGSGHLRHDVTDTTLNTHDEETE